MRYKKRRHGLYLRPICMIFAVIFSVLRSYAVSDEEYILDEDSIDTPQHDTKITLRQFIVPISLMTYGTVEATVHKKRGIFNLAITHEVLDHNPVKYKIDNYMQYLPAAGVYLLNFSGIKGKHNLKESTIILGIASIYTAVSVNAIKYTVRENRPDKSQRNSFPSGHTTVAFMGAEFLWQEYKDVSPWYGIGGYFIAASTGAFRIYNLKHWLGDVFFGAGLGMVCTKLAYMTYPVLHRKLGLTSGVNKSQDVTFCPYYTGQEGGLMVMLQF